VSHSKARVVDAIGLAAKLVGRKTFVSTLVITLMRVMTGLLDFCGIALLSAFAATALSNGGDKGARLPKLLDRLETLRLSPLVLLLIALVFLSTKSMLSFFLTVSLTKTLNRRCSEIIAQESVSLADVDKDFIDQFSSQRLHFLLTAGLRAGTVGILNPMSSLLTEGSLLLLLVTLLISTSLFASLVSILLTGVSSFLLYKFVSVRLYRIGQMNGAANIRSMSLLQESVHGYRELFVLGNLRTHLQKFAQVEYQICDLQTEQTKLGTLPRYFLETIVMISLGCVATIAMFRSNGQQALLLLTIFAATASRILPSLVPLQSSLSEIQTNMGLSVEFQLIMEMKKKLDGIGKYPQQIKRTVVQFPVIPSVEFIEVNYKYPGASKLAVANIDFEFVGPGWLAIDGPSGSGKSTIFDLLMGVKKPASGNILINGCQPREIIESQRGLCAYLPQRITMSNASLAENVAFGLNKEDIDQKRVVEVMDLVGLKSLTGRSDFGIWEPLGELGEAVSGGQLQRLGIARCLYNNPSLLLLDECTTGLDVNTQTEILNIFTQLSQKIQVISISHDQNIVKRADVTLVLNEGKLAKRS